MDGIVQPKVDDESAAQAALVLLRRQAHLFGRLESLAAKQGDLVSRDDATPLLALLAERQRLAAELSQIGGRLEPARRNWVATRNALTPLERDEADGLLTQVRERMRRLIDNDERDARVLSARKESVATSLRQTQTIGSAVSAYRPHGGAVSRSNRLDEAS